MTRRRAMMGGRPEWDFEWDYTMGSPANRGCTITGTEAMLKMKSDCMELGYYSGWVGIYLPVNKVDSGVLEVEYAIHKYANAYNFRPAIGGDTNALGICHRSAGFWLQFLDNSTAVNSTIINGSSANPLQFAVDQRYKLTMTLNEDGTVKIERDGKVYYNKALPKECLYSNRLWLCQQQPNSTPITRVYAFRAKYNRTE